MPVGGRDRRRTGTHGIGQRATGNLGFVLVGTHEDVSGLKVVAQLFGRHELILKYDVVPDAEPFGLRLRVVRYASPYRRRIVGWVGPTTK